MKKHIFCKTQAFFALGAFLFAGCQDFTGTVANFAEKNDQYTAIVDNKSQTTSSNSSVTVSATTIASASSKSEITLSITSLTKLDMDSVADAVYFQSLTNNSTNALYYPVRGSDFTKTLSSYTESATVPISDGAGSVTTTLNYTADLSGVTTDKIAVFVDATKLKTKQGNYALNLDDDETPGEETDNFVDYIGITARADGTTLTAITNTEAEQFGKSLSLTPTVSEVTGTNNVPVYLAILVGAPDTTAIATPLGTTTYLTGLESTLGKMYKLQKQSAGTTTWTDIAFTFAYSGDAAASVDGYTVAGANQYYATTSLSGSAYGDTYRLVKTTQHGITWSDGWTNVVGHPCYIDGTGSTTYTQIVSGVSYIYNYVSSSTIIVSAPSNLSSVTAQTWSGKDVSESDIESAQQAAFTSIQKNTSGGISFVTTLDSAKGLSLYPSAWSDFIVVDSNYTKLESTASATYDDSGNVSAVTVRLTNTNYTGNAILMVGHGTELSANKVYSEQVTFGAYASKSYLGDAADYVKLSE